MIITRRNLVISLILLIGLLISACGGGQMASTVLDPPQPIPDFTLSDQNGQIYRLSRSDAKLTIIYFGYSYCPDFCPTTLAELSRALDALGGKARQVDVLFITIDPARDTAQRLAAYLTIFDDSIIGLRTDNQEELQSIVDSFSVFYEPEAPAEGTPNEYLVSHTTAVMVVDDELQFRAVIPYGTSGEDIASDLRQLLRR